MPEVHTSALDVKIVISIQCCFITRFRVLLGDAEEQEYSPAHLKRKKHQATARRWPLQIPAWDGGGGRGGGGGSGVILHPLGSAFRELILCTRALLVTCLLPRGRPGACSLDSGAWNLT